MEEMAMRVQSEDPKLMMGAFQYRGRSIGSHIALCAPETGIH